ncbi:MAG: hypothetical protein R3C45_12490 [Phycisphaerales bacterium]
MRIYEVRHDVEKYQSVSFCDEKLWASDMFPFDCYPPKGDAWRVQEVYVLNPKLRSGDFTYLCSGVLVFRETALNALLDLFEMSGEILPLHVEGSNEQLYLHNVLECPNALDQQKTEWHTSSTSGKRLSIKRHVLHKNRLFESPLFKVPESCRASVLTFSGMKDARDEFKSRYEEAGLTGLYFIEECVL